MDHKKKNSFLILYFMVCLVVSIIFKIFFMLNYIPSSSMEPTIQQEDIVFATRNFDEIARYDIMIFWGTDESNTYYIKRVLGLPGETIQIKNGKVYADGMQLEDSFIKEEMIEEDVTYQVPKDTYFMLGDNRNDSLDSRYWENKYVPVQNFVAKAIHIILPFKHIQSLDWRKL